MPAEASLLPEAFATLSAAFSTEPPAVGARITLEEVRRFLIGRITELLDRQPEYLMHILYRVDVAEERVKQVFEAAPPEDIAPCLADLLIERQLQKVRLRRRYPGGRSGSDA